MTNRRSTTSGFTPVSDIVERSGDSLLHRARWLETVNRRLLALLPPALRDHVRIANVQDEILVLQVESPAWSAKMRFHTPAILDAARQVGLHVSQVRLKIAPPPVPPGQVNPTSTPWPPQVRRDIIRALGLREDPESESNHPSPSKSDIVNK